MSELSTATGPLRRSLVFATDELEPLVHLALRAEEAGLDRVWTTEYVHRDAVARALAIALATKRIGVATGIAYAFTRLPLAMAGLAADVQRMSGGRFALGISSGTRGVRRWYGAEFDPPAPSIGAYADALRAAWAENTALEIQAPKIYAAALNPIMTRTVARTCDGALLHALALSRTHLHERLLPALRQGLDERSQGAPFEMAAWCITSIDEDEERARELARRQLAFYLSTPSYSTVTAGTPWDSVADDVRSAFDESGRKASWGELSSLIPDAVVDELTISGSPAVARERALALEQELRALGVTELVFQLAGADVSTTELIASCERIADELAPGAVSENQQATGALAGDTNSEVSK
ncbi:MAG: class flavin-dependent oxidoreductase [Solirubrobacterales bacterium]|jgi:alkanesulfonate monooxygenase SsuD/methylene tetrahydromethanopterin reductase-like flavin-dependent oxidoreductase (luciferase family)|nr:class flavin-dependent oxidoreductase [Solirubrobacterales bacterium]